MDKMILDAAHDAESIYVLLEHQGMEPFIDLNVRSKKNTPAKDGIQISPTGIPICPKGTNQMGWTKNVIAVSGGAL
jgi:hypothetical protein